MATSGVFSQTFSTWYRAQIEWTSTQSASNNATTITAKLYLISLSARSSISSSSSKSIRITIDGTNSFGTANLNLSGNQKKLMHTFTKIVPHDADGRKTVTIQGLIPIEIPLGGSYVSNVGVSKSEVLTPLQASSTVGTISSWRAGESMSVSITRASTNYTHVVRVYLGTELIATRDGVAANVTFDFDGTETGKIFAQIGRGSSVNGRVEVDTYSGGSKVGGTSSKDTFVMGGLPSTYSVSTTMPDVGDTITFTLNTNNSEFNHTIILMDGGVEVARKEVAAGVSSTTFPTGVPISSSILSRMGTAESKVFTFEVYTKWNLQNIRDPETSSVRFYKSTTGGGGGPTEGAPTYTGAIGTSDSNITVRNLLGAGSNYYLNGESTVVVTIATKAVPKGTATIESYTVTVGDDTRTYAETSGTITATFPNARTRAGGLNIIVTARDSNGLSATQTKRVDFIDYSVPTIQASAKRVGRFENTTNISFSTPYAPIVKTASPLNAIVSRRYRYRQQGGGWYGWVAVSTALSTVTAQLNLDNTKAWELQMEVTDRIKTTTRSITIAAGRPTLFIDAERNSVGVNVFPSGNDQFETTRAVINEVTIGQGLDDIVKIGSEFRIGQSNGTISFGNDLFKMTRYAGDVTLTTNTGKFYFSQVIQAAGGINGTLTGNSYGTHVGSVSGDVSGTLNGNVNTYSGSSQFNAVNVNGRLTVSAEPISTVSETGFCGVGGSSHTSTTGATAGVGVNFRIKKNYVPSYISMSSQGDNTGGNVSTLNITADGFWMYISGGNSTSFRYWRGNYSA